jgi:UDPglucose--hexose-1-phosphate uridylyltransferase
MKNQKSTNYKPCLPAGRLQTTNSELRKDYFLNRFVLITPGRAKRPRDIEEKTVITKDKMCQFCPENIDLKNIIDTISGRRDSEVSPSRPHSHSWKTLSIGNIFPAVTLNNPRAYGKQEVIIDTPKHNINLGELSITEIENVLKMFARRTQEIAKNKKIEYILCFKNQGSKAGASIAHAHSQIFATSLIPPDVAEENYYAQLFEKENHLCPYCQIIKQELKSPRKIWGDKNIVAIAPYASQFHYEAWLLPKRHLDNIALLNMGEIKSLAVALQKILHKLDQADISYNLFLHNIIRETNQHLYIKIQPRDSVWAGVELGSGLVINSVSPEEASLFYKS